MDVEVESEEQLALKRAHIQRLRTPSAMPLDLHRLSAINALASSSTASSSLSQTGGRTFLPTPIRPSSTLILSKRHQQEETVDTTASNGHLTNGIGGGGEASDGSPLFSSHSLSSYPRPTVPRHVPPVPAFHDSPSQPHLNNTQHQSPSSHSHSRSPFDHYSSPSQPPPTVHHSGPVYYVIQAPPAPHHPYSHPAPFPPPSFNPYLSPNRDPHIPPPHSHFFPPDQHRPSYPPPLPPPLLPPPSSSSSQPPSSPYLSPYLSEPLNRSPVPPFFSPPSIRPLSSSSSSSSPPPHHLLSPNGSIPPPSNHSPLSTGSGISFASLQKYSGQQPPSSISSTTPKNMVLNKPPLPPVHSRTPNSNTPANNILTYRTSAPSLTPTAAFDRAWAKSPMPKSIPFNHPLIKEQADLKAKLKLEEIEREEKEAAERKEKEREIENVKKEQPEVTNEVDIEKMLQAFPDHQLDKRRHIGSIKSKREENEEEEEEEQEEEEEEGEEVAYEEELDEEELTAEPEIEKEQEDDDEQRQPAPSSEASPEDAAALMEDDGEAEFTVEETDVEIVGEEGEPALVEAKSDRRGSAPFRSKEATSLVTPVQRPRKVYRIEEKTQQDNEEEATTAATVEDIKSERRDDNRRKKAEQSDRTSSNSTLPKDKSIAKSSSSSHSTSLSRKSDMYLSHWYLSLHQPPPGVPILVIVKGHSPSVGIYTSGPILERLSSTAVDTHSRVYRLEGPFDEESMRLKSGLSEEVIEKFRKGWPEDWVKVLTREMNRNNQKEAEKEQAEVKERNDSKSKNMLRPDNSETLMEDNEVENTKPQPIEKTTKRGKVSMLKERPATVRQKKSADITLPAKSSKKEEEAKKLKPKPKSKPKSKKVKEDGDMEEEEEDEKVEEEEKEESGNESRKRTAAKSKAKVSQKKGITLPAYEVAKEGKEEKSRAKKNVPPTPLRDTPIETGVVSLDSLPHLVSRSGRLVVKPLEHWKFEQLVDGVVVRGYDYEEAVKKAKETEDQLRKEERKKEGGNSTHEWTAEELQALQSAYMAVLPSSRTFWFDVATLINTARTAEECQRAYEQLFPTPKPIKRKKAIKRKKIEDDKDNADEEIEEKGNKEAGEEAINSQSTGANNGKKKKKKKKFEKKQTKLVRALQLAHSKDGQESAQVGDDIFDSTPIRKLYGKEKDLPPLSIAVQPHPIQDNVETTAESKNTSHTNTVASPTSENVSSSSSPLLLSHSTPRQASTILKHSVRRKKVNRKGKGDVPTETETQSHERTRKNMEQDVTEEGKKTFEELELRKKEQEDEEEEDDQLLDDDEEEETSE